METPMSRALAAIRFAKEQGLELQSATWDGAEEWRLTFYLPSRDAKDSTPTPRPGLASRLIVDEDDGEG